ncbi:MAG: hypothetical protein Q4F13_10385 [Pseudomonadota bacterium]|nr:hypothetical protein [Pseudomonadota bacterium]
MTRSITPCGFRTLAIASVLLAVAASVVDTLWPALLPTEWQLLADETAVPWLPEGDMAFGLLLLGLGAYVLLAVTATVAMCFFKPWGRRLSLWCSVLAVPVVVWLGPDMLSGLAGALLDLSSMLWGATLALAYFSPLAQRFVRA